MKEKINITLPDGTKKEFSIGTTGYDIAKNISEGLAKQAILIELDGSLRDLFYPINEDASLKILKKEFLVKEVGSFKWMIKVGDITWAI